MRAKTIIGVFALLCVAPSAYGQSSGPACAQVEGDEQRLECYDLVFRADRISDGAVADAGKWEVTEDVSKFDDSRTVFLRLTSEDTHPGKFGGQTHSYLAIACREHDTNLWMTFADSFMSSNTGGGSVTYRLDSDPAESKPFTESNNNKSLGLWSGSSSVPFAKAMIGKDRLVVRATPYNASSVTATYDIRGLSKAIEPLRAACDW